MDRARFAENGRKIFDFLTYLSRRISWTSGLERRQLARRPFPRLPLFFFSSLEGIRAVYLSVACSSQLQERARIEFPDSRVLWFSRRIGGKNFGGNNHVGRWKLIHQVDKRHNFHARREKQFYRRVNYALFFSFFQLYIEIGSRNWPTSTYFIVRHIPE